MAEQNLNRGIELHSKALALSVALPLGCRGAATAFPSSLSLSLRIIRVHQLAMPSYGPVWPSSQGWVRKQQNYSRALWHHRVHFIFPFLRSRSRSLFLLLYLFLSCISLFLFLFVVEAAAFQIVSASRETKGKGWRCKMSPLYRHERAYMSMIFELRYEPSVSWHAR